MAGRNESFFHGTVHNIGVGRHVLPGREVGHSNWGDTGSGSGQASEDHAFATTSESTAWDFASDAVKYGGARGRARVYTVAPHPDMRPGIHTEFGEHFAPSFRTTGQLDIKPGHQGTFPNINWQQFQGHRMKVKGDVNHPTPEAVVAENKPLNSWAPERDLASDNQLDLFTGRTAMEHGVSLEDRKTGLAQYHAQRMLGSEYVG